jgi:uncharacterized membrane protein
MNYKLLAGLLMVVMSWFAVVPEVWAQEDMTMEAKVVWIVEEGEIEFSGKTQPFQVLTFEITSGAEAGKRIEYEHGMLPAAHVDVFKVGDRVIMGKNDPGDDDSYYLVDRIRRDSLYLLGGIFLGVIVLVARGRAVRSVLALAASFVVIFYFILPQLLAGNSPILVTMAASALIIPLTFYLSHGFVIKTHVAVIGTLIALLITAMLASLFVSGAHLSGYASEEAAFLQAERSFLNIQGLLLAGIIIGVLGILDDVTVSQAGIVKQLLSANSKLSFRQLYSKAMDVGTDHIASMINTLVLVYAGASMPLLLLFVDSPKSVAEIINYEMVAEEIVRTLTGSIGLVLAVPITTILAAWWYKRAQKT